MLIAYNTTRTITLSMTYDEAATYLWHVGYPWRQILSFSTSGLPDNNHVLFTLLAKLAIHLFGDTSFSLRLPSAIGYVLYCLAAAAILRRFATGPLLVLLVLLIAANPLLLEVMAIARGYGLGIALATIGTWALLRASGEHRTLWTWVATVAFALAAMAHLSFVLFFLVSMALLAADHFVGWRSKRVSGRGLALAALAPLSVGLPLAWFLMRQIALLQQLGLLKTEGLNSFYADTIRTVVAASLFDGEGSQAGIDLVCVLACLALPGMVMATLLAKTMTDADRRRRHDFLLLLGLLLGVGLSSYLQHGVFHVAFLSGRRAVSLFPTYVFCIAATIAPLMRSANALRRAAAYALIGSSLIATLQFVQSASVRRTADWRFDADVDTMVADLEAIAGCLGARPVVLGADWLFDRPVNYYIRRDHITRIAPVPTLYHVPLIERLDQSDPQRRSDAYYLLDADLSRLQRARGPQTILRSYPNSETVLTTPASSHLSPCTQAKTGAARPVP